MDELKQIMFNNLKSGLLQVSNLINWTLIVCTLIVSQALILSIKNKNFKRYSKLLVIIIGIIICSIFWVTSPENNRSILTVTFDIIAIFVSVLIFSVTDKWKN